MPIPSLSSWRRKSLGRKEKKEKGEQEIVVQIDSLVFYDTFVNKRTTTKATKAKAKAKKKKKTEKK